MQANNRNDLKLKTKERKIFGIGQGRRKHNLEEHRVKGTPYYKKRE